MRSSVLSAACKASSTLGRHGTSWVIGGFCALPVSSKGPGMTATTKAATSAETAETVTKTTNFLPDEIQRLPLDQQVKAYWDSGLNWIENNTLEIIIAAVIGTLIYLGLNWLRGFAARKARKIEDDGSLSRIALNVLARTNQFFVTMVPLKLLSRFAATPQSIDTIIGFLFTVAAVFQVAIWAREIILGMIQRRTTLGEPGDTETLSNAMGLIKIFVSVALFGVATIMVLDNLGVNVTGLIAGLGIGGIAIGLAAQGIFSDLFSALSIIFDKPFSKGDTIQYDTTTATVEKIGLKSTRLRATTGEQKIISNANLLGKEITSLTRLYRRRVLFNIGIIYQTDPAKARALPEICEEVVKEAGHEMFRCVLIAFGPSSLDYELQFDVNSADLMYVAQEKSRVGLLLWERLGKEGIEFAYPTQTTFTAAPDGEMILPYASKKTEAKT